MAACGRMLQLMIINGKVMLSIRGAGIMIGASVLTMLLMDGGGYSYTVILR